MTMPTITTHRCHCYKPSSQAKLLAATIIRYDRIPLTSLKLAVALLSPVVITHPLSFVVAHIPPSLRLLTIAEHLLAFLKHCPLSHICCLLPQPLSLPVGVLCRLSEALFTTAAHFPLFLLLFLHNLICIG